MECPICFVGIELATTGIATMACSHSFHFHCLAKWFILQPEGVQTCPCCRREANSFEKVPEHDEFAEDSDYETDDEDEEGLEAFYSSH
jgi:Ring finger domain